MRLLSYFYLIVEIIRVIDLKNLYSIFDPVIESMIGFVAYFKTLAIQVFRALSPETSPRLSSKYPSSMPKAQNLISPL